MRYVDTSGKTLFARDYGSMGFGQYSWNLMLGGTGSLASLQFRSGTNPFAQVQGGQISNLNFDATGALWRWRSVLGSDSNTVMELQSGLLQLKSVGPSKTSEIQFFRDPLQPSVRTARIGFHVDSDTMFIRNDTATGTLVLNTAGPTNHKAWAMDAAGRFSPANGPFDLGGVSSVERVGTIFANNVGRSDAPIGTVFANNLGSEAHPIGTVNATLIRRPSSFEWMSTTGTFPVGGHQVAYLNLGNVHWAGTIEVRIWGDWNNGRAHGSVAKRYTWYKGANVALDPANVMEETSEAHGFIAQNYALGAMEPYNTNQVRIPIYQLPSDHSNSLAIEVVARNITPAALDNLRAALSIIGPVTVENSATRNHVSLSNSNLILASGSISATSASLSGALTASSGTFSGALTASSGTFNGGLSANGGITLGNPVTNVLAFGDAGVNAPTFTVRSAGTKILLFNNLSATTTDFAIGRETAAMWFSVPMVASLFKWYGGTTEMMSLQSGVLNLQTGLKISGAAAAGKYLRGDGTNFVPSDLLPSDLPREIPVGAIMAFHASIRGASSLDTSRWAYCDGTTGHTVGGETDVTMPLLNGTEELDRRFLRGTSGNTGATGGTLCHTHGFTPATVCTSGSGTNVASGISMALVLPPYFEIRWIMRIA